MALEARLRNRSQQTGVALDRLRRRVVVERLLARLLAAEPGRWVLKGGMALEARLLDDARLTKDVDLGLRDVVDTPADLHERLVEALSVDPDGDGFVIAPEPPLALLEHRTGDRTWRVKVNVDLDGTLFGRIQLDVSPRAHELDATDRLTLGGGLLDFADIVAPVAEVVDVHRHGAEKFHAMLRTFDDRANTRVRDLVDLVLLVEHDLVQPASLAQAVRQVWAERDSGEPPTALPELPAAWPERYRTITAELSIRARSFDDAVALVEQLWSDMFPRRLETVPPA